MKRYILPFAAAGSLLFAVTWTFAERPVRKPSEPLMPPPETTSTQTVAAVGLVEPGTENISLSCAVSGLVTSLYVKAGDRVRSGKKLFQVDNRDLVADLAAKRAALDVARAQFAKLEAEPRPEELPPAKAKVAEAKAQLDDAEVQVRVIESVADMRAVKKEDVLRRRLALQAAQARMAQAEKDLALLKAETWAPDLAIARAQVQQAEAAVRQDEVALDRLTTRAPMDGIILQNKVRLGQYAQCGPLTDPLMVFGGGSEVHVRADVDEEDAWRVKGGAPAIARVRGNSVESYALGTATERVDTRVLQLIYRFRNKNVRVFNGQQMDVFIDAASGARGGSQ